MGATPESISKLQPYVWIPGSLAALAPRNDSVMNRARTSRWQIARTDPKFQSSDSAIERREVHW
jgi:hypothetical protein